MGSRMDIFDSEEKMQICATYLNCMLLLKAYGKAITKDLLGNVVRATGTAAYEELLDKMSNVAVSTDMVNSYDKVVGLYTGYDPVLKEEPMAIAILVLSSANKDVNAENLTRLLEAAGKHPNKKVIRKEIDRYNRYTSAKTIEDGPFELHEIDEGSEEDWADEFEEAWGDEFQTYAKAVSMLYMAGAELNEQNVEGILTTMKLKPRAELIGEVLDTRKNTVALASLKKSVEDMEKRVEAQEIEQDHENLHTEKDYARNTAIFILASMMACDILENLDIELGVAKVADILTAAHIKPLNLHIIESIVEREKIQNEFMEQLAKL